MYEHSRACAHSYIIHRTASRCAPAPPPSPGEADARAPHVGQRTSCAHRQRVPGSGAHPQPPAFFDVFKSRVANKNRSWFGPARAMQKPGSGLDRTAPPLPLGTTRPEGIACPRTAAMTEWRHWSERISQRIEPQLHQHPTGGEW